MAKTKVKNEELIRLARNGDLDAEEQLFIYNEPFCYHLANKFKNANIDKEEIVSIAKLGLVKAYKSFDVDKGYMFLTYASRIMENEILMAMRKSTKYKGDISIETPLNYDADGNELKLEDVYAAPETNLYQDEMLVLQNAINVFKENAKERDIIILEQCILGEAKQRELAKQLNISQSYIARICMRIEKQLKNIVETGNFRNYNANTNRTKIEGECKEVTQRVYSADDFIYVFENYPKLGNREVATIMNVHPNYVATKRSTFKKGILKSVGHKVNSKLIEKLKMITMDTEKKVVDKQKVTIKKEPKVKEEIVNTLIKRSIKENHEALEKLANRDKEKEEVKKPIPIIEKAIEDYTKEIMNKKETIILNNQISITSDKKEVANLIYGIFELLDKTPTDSKIKLDLHFEVSR